MRLDGEDRRIECLWERVSLSAHAPTRDLHAFAELMTPRPGADRVLRRAGARRRRRELANWINDSLGDRGATRPQPPRQTPWTSST